MIGDFNHGLADAQPRAGGKIAFVQIEIDNQIVAGEIHAPASPAMASRNRAFITETLRERIGIRFQVPAITFHAVGRADNRLRRRCRCSSGNRSTMSFSTPVSLGLARTESRRTRGSMRGDPPL